MSKLFIQGAKKGDEQALTQVIKDVFLQASDNLSWLKPGETVLLKPALNSPHPHPSTTHPLAVKVVGQLLQEHGAKVIVGDQPGLEHALQNEAGSVSGVSRDSYEKSGMSAGAGLEFIGFEEKGWSGYDKFKSAKTASWPDGFYITNLIKSVDHIISLPRLSTHVQAGASLGFKNMVGLLRLDSRLDFHANGPYNSVVKHYARPAKLKVKNDGTGRFFEKIVEISLAVQEKLRLTLITATKAQVTFGPDKYIMHFGKGGLLRAYQVEPDPGLVFASPNQVAVEVVGLAYLKILSKNIPAYHKIWQGLSMLTNGQAKSVAHQAVWANRFVKQALKLGLGSDNFEMSYTDVPENIMHQLNKFIKK